MHKVATHIKKLSKWETMNGGNYSSFLNVLYTFILSPSYILPSIWKLNWFLQSTNLKLLSSYLGTSQLLLMTEKYKFCTMIQGHWKLGSYFPSKPSFLYAPIYSACLNPHLSSHTPLIHSAYSFCVFIMFYQTSIAVPTFFHL